ncbi:MAG: LysR substrate-binding domain-containing protein [Anaeromyxobacter sp.]
MGTAPRDVETEATPFADHPLVMVAHPDHPLARRRRAPLRELAAETFLVRERGSGTRAAMERLLRAAGVRPAGMTEISSNETIKQAVMAGMGVAFISLHAIGLELATQQLAILPVEGLPVMRAWNVVHRAGKALTPAAAAFKAFVLEEGQTFLARWPDHAGAPVAGRGAQPSPSPASTPRTRAGSANHTSRLRGTVPRVCDEVAGGRLRGLSRPCGRERTRPLRSASTPSPSSTAASSSSSRPRPSSTAARRSGWSARTAPASPRSSA